jgi:hypothetical protein
MEDATGTEDEEAQSQLGDGNRGQSGMMLLRGIRVWD